MIEECTHAACSGRRLAQATTTNDACRAVVSDLVSLIEHARNGLRLMIAAEIPLISPESSINVIVLDDVSPRYMKAAAAVQACDVNLGIALRSLLDAEDTGRPALSVIGT